MDTKNLVLRAEDYAQQHPDFLTYLNENKGITNADQLLKATKDAAAAVANWVDSNFPRGGQDNAQGEPIGAQNYLLSQTLGDTGPEDRTFSTSLTDSLADLLDLFAGTIETTTLT